MNHSDRDFVAPGLPAYIPVPPVYVNASLEQRAIGALVGSAVGDALGARFEFGPAGAYRRELPESVVGGIGEMVGGGPFPWRPGEFTDDTQMALALSESLLACGGFDADDVWQRFRAWSASATDVGVLTRRVLAQPDWRGAAASAHRANGGLSAANGALMRVTGLAIAYAGADRPDLIQAARAQAALTHFDPAAGWGAALGAQLIQLALFGSMPLSGYLQPMHYLPDAVRGPFATTLDRYWDPRAPGTVSSGTVWGCLGRAVWALHHSSSFEEAVVTAIELGGDTDTVAAVTGALAGATYGIQGIPSRWTTYVNGTVDGPDGGLTYNNDGLQIVARELLGLTASPPTPPATSTGPVRVAPRLHAADLGGAAIAPSEWAVVSLCRTGGGVAHHPVRREIYLIDQPGHSNVALGAAVADAVDSIDAFLAEGRDVLVHCHAGRSRTGLVLKAWAMRANGWTEPEAHAWLASKWHRYDPYQASFTDLLSSGWAGPGD